jgi:hypothetical protein
VDIREAVQGEADLLEIVAARRSPCRLACRLHGWQKQADERADDRDHHQELDQRETAGSARANRPDTPRFLAAQKHLHGHDTPPEEKKTDGKR